MSIKKGANTSDVIVTYDICFSFCERLDGTVFIELITLEGDDLITDNHCIKVTKACVSRKIARKVNNNVLDEDPKIL
ncbi:hypothetical protein N7U66_08590 [Lacinutrix neustonica]|uniref:Uncharacterized protein n=1 Tax=Lacinutrix neustonica TaxID=2980107 RepID=A0A9E8MY56_9FLAO|nr:hypothetical protein [Lacinutrix neustonica]WAC03521.1 hypothetical protein N7U66_08590 [Lacinutrix neustonica]